MVSCGYSAVGVEGKVEENRILLKKKIVGKYHQWWLKMLNRQTVVPQPNERKSEFGEEKMEKTRHT